jgi:hypothetical protein
MILISTLSLEVESALKVSCLANKTFPEIKVLLGGIHSTFINMYKSKKSWLGSMITYRGCPYQCTNVHNVLNDYLLYSKF